jgi:hypothetical protein
MGLAAREDAAAEDEHQNSDKRQHHEIEAGQTEAHVVDGKSRDHGAEETGESRHHGEVAEAARVFLRLAQHAHQVLQGHGVKGERQAEQRRGQVQRRQSRNQVRDNHAAGAAGRAEDEQPARTKAVGHSARQPRE